MALELQKGAGKSGVLFKSRRWRGTFVYSWKRVGRRERLVAREGATTAETPSNCLWVTGGSREAHPHIREKLPMVPGVEMKSEDRNVREAGALGLSKDSHGKSEGQEGLQGDSGHIPPGGPRRLCRDRNTAGPQEPVSPRSARKRLLLFQKHRGPGHHGDPAPVPYHDYEDAGRQEGLHGEPHLGEASVLVDSLDRHDQNSEGQYIFALLSLLLLFLTT